MPARQDINNRRGKNRGATAPRSRSTTQAVLESSQALLVQTQKPADEAAFNAAFGKRLREFRERRQMTQCELGKRLEVSQQAVYAYEAGTSAMSPAHINAACKALQIDPLILFGWSEDVYARKVTPEDGVRFAEFLNTLDPKLRAATKTLICFLTSTVRGFHPHSGDGPDT